MTSDVFLNFTNVCVPGAVKGAGSREHRNGCPHGAYFLEEGD